MAGWGDAGTEAPNFDFVVFVVAGGWPSRVPCLPTIMYNYIAYLG
jgi:hypothetical protein